VLKPLIFKLMLILKKLLLAKNRLLLQIAWWGAIMWRGACSNGHSNKANLGSTPGSGHNCNV